MKIDAAILKDFYNNGFFDKEGKSKPTKVSLTVEIEGGQSMRLPNCTVMVHHSLEQIIKGYYHFLSMQKEEVNFTQPENDVVNFEKINYRDNIYMVELLEDETFKISNMETGKEVTPDSPFGKAIIKEFKMVEGIQE